MGKTTHVYLARADRASQRDYSRTATARERAIVRRAERRAKHDAQERI